MQRATKITYRRDELSPTLGPVIRTNLTHKFTETDKPLKSELEGGGLIVGDGLHPSTRPIK